MEMIMREQREIDKRAKEKVLEAKGNGKLKLWGTAMNECFAEGYLNDKKISTDIFANEFNLLMDKEAKNDK